MMKKIAVLYDENNQITDVFHINSIVIYHKIDSWQEYKILSDIAIKISEAGNIRDSIELIIKSLEDCKVIIGTLIVGIPYYILDKNGFIICEAEKFSQALLEEISMDYLEKKIEVKENEVLNLPKSPRPIDNEGNFFFDFAMVQKNFPEISSKKALLPFFSNELFHSITIVCTHIMPWLDTYIEQRNFKLESKREDGLYTLIITHKQCNEN